MGEKFLTGIRLWDPKPLHLYIKNSKPKNPKILEALHPEPLHDNDAVQGSALELFRKYRVWGIIHGGG